MKKLRWTLAAGLALGLGLLGSVLWRQEGPVGPPASPPYVTYFLIDGLSQEVFREELAAGRLPALARLIAEGTYVEDGISAFPSMTGYAFYPFLTGRDAAASGVLGLRWFSRSAAEGNFRNYVGRTNWLMNGDLSAQPPTLFECFPGQHSLSVNSYVNRGVVREEKLGYDFSMAKYRDTHAVGRWVGALPLLGRRLMPDWFAAETATLERMLLDLPRRPKVQWVTFASPDGRQHVAGIDEMYPRLLRHIDGLIARYREESRRLGQEKDRIYVVVSDHGVVDVAHNIDLRQPLADVGVRAWRGEATHLGGDTLSEPLSTWADMDVVLAVNGNTMNHVYLRDGNALAGAAWRTRPPVDAALAFRSLAGGPPVDLVERLRRVEGVELVASRAQGGEVRLWGPRGEAAIRAEASGYTYRCRGEDPLGYAASARTAALCDGQPRSAQEWLAATHATPFPDAVHRLWALMSAPDVGDLVVTAQAGYDLASDYELIVGNYRGGHGGLRADQLRVPYILAGPGVPAARRLPAARAEDVGATLKQLLGCPLPAGAEGRPLF